MPGMTTYSRGLKAHAVKTPPAVVARRCGRLSSGRDEAGSIPGRSLDRYGRAGVSRTTAGTPSGLMLKARKVNGLLPGLPH